MATHLRLALRRFAKEPGFTAIAVLTLAIAIGMNSAIFSLINEAILKAPGSVRPEEVVSIFSSSRDAQKTFRQFSFAEFQAARGTNDPFIDVAAINFNMVSLGRAESFRRASAFMVSENYFELMGAKPAAGRFFSADESRPGAGERVVIASHEFWMRSGGAPTFVGSTILVNSRAHTIIGVSPEAFSGVSALVAPELWLPLGLFGEVADAFARTPRSPTLDDPSNYTLNLMGRLKPGLTVDSATPRLPAVAARLAEAQPSDSAGARELTVAKPFSISPQPASPRALRTLGLFLLGMSGVVLLIACLNLANMLLARSSVRAPEMALRLALGASRRQIVNQLLMESLVLSLCGGAIGLLLSVGASAAMKDLFTAFLNEEGFGLIVRLAPDLRVIGATFVFCLIATVTFGLGPALRSTRLDLVQDLKAHAGPPAAAGRWTRFFSARHTMVMTQMAFSVVLVFAASTFVRTAVNAGARDGATGFDTVGVILAELDFSLAQTPEAEALRRVDAAATRLRVLPGVEAVGASTLVPYVNEIQAARLLPARANVGDLPVNGVAGIASAVTPGYFASIGVDIVAGRDFRAGEGTLAGAGPRVCILDEGMAARLFPAGNAVGQRVRPAQGSADDVASEMAVVGVIRRHAHGLEDKGRPLPGVYEPLGQAYRPKVFLMARVARRDSLAASETASTIRKALREVDADLPVLQISPYETFTEKNFTLWMMRLGATMFGAFGAFALLLAAIGVYGVKAHAVSTRTREIGVRLALGATPRQVFGLIMKQGIEQTALAATAGLLMSVGVARILASLFLEVKPDPVALIESIGVVAGTMLLACVAPARRATAVSPMKALRAGGS
jgi:putative ABC transport system permease protein